MGFRRTVRDQSARLEPLVSKLPRELERFHADFERLVGTTCKHREPRTLDQRCGFLARGRFVAKEVERAPGRGVGVVATADLPEHVG